MEKLYEPRNELSQEEVDLRFGELAELIDEVPVEDQEYINAKPTRKEPGNQDQGWRFD